MPALKIPKPGKERWYICIENHTSDRGTYRVGDRLRGDHPDVIANTIWWVEEGMDTDQLHAERQRRVDGAYGEGSRT